MKKIYLLSGIILITCVAMSCKDTEAEFTAPDLAMFGLKGHVRSINVTNGYLNITDRGDTIFKPGENPDDYRTYTFNYDGKLTKGDDGSNVFTIEYSHHPDGIITLEEHDCTITRNKEGRISEVTLNDGSNFTYTFIYDGAKLNKVVNQNNGIEWPSVEKNTRIISSDDYGNPLSEESEGNNGQEDGDYTQTTTYSYVYDTHGNWTVRETTSIRRYKKPQATFSGEPAPQEETYLHRDIRKIKYFTPYSDGNASAFQNGKICVGNFNGSQIDTLMCIPVDPASTEPDTGGLHFKWKVFAKNGSVKDMTVDQTTGIHFTNMGDLDYDGADEWAFVNEWYVSNWQSLRVYTYKDGVGKLLYEPQPIFFPHIDPEEEYLYSGYQIEDLVTPCKPGHVMVKYSTVINDGMDFVMLDTIMQVLR